MSKRAIYLLIGVGLLPTLAWAGPRSEPRSLYQRPESSCRGLELEAGDQGLESAGAVDLTSSECGHGPGRGKKNAQGGQSFQRGAITRCTVLRQENGPQRLDFDVGRDHWPVAAAAGFVAQIWLIEVAEMHAMKEAMTAAGLFSIEEWRPANEAWISGPNWGGCWNARRAAREIDFPRPGNSMRLGCRISLGQESSG
jgi:hypothetical protein